MTTRRCMVMAFCLAGLHGCDMTNRETNPGNAEIKAAKTGDGKVRNELAPIAARFPMLKNAKSIQWTSGVMGDPAMPGPSLYWIDAVIRPDAALLEKISQLESLAHAQPPGDMHPAIQRLIPEGRYQTSPELDGLFTHGTWLCQAYFEPSQNLVLLLAKGQ